jgi:hypothetical protein
MDVIRKGVKGVKSVKSVKIYLLYFSQSNKIFERN